MATPKPVVSRRIVYTTFTLDAQRGYEVYIMNADGSNPAKIVDANVQLKRWDFERLSWLR